MVDLGDQPAGLDPQVVDDHPVLGFTPMDFYLVGGFLFAPDACLNIANFLLDTLPGVGTAVGAGEQGLQCPDRGFLVVGFFDDHRALFVSCKKPKG